MGDVGLVGGEDAVLVQGNIMTDARSGYTENLTSTAPIEISGGDTGDSTTF